VELFALVAGSIIHEFKNNNLSHGNNS
jgi:hypothetical protein